MKSFLDFLNERYNKLPVVETVFGSHSQPLDSLDEARATDPYKASHQVDTHSREDQEHIHAANELPASEHLRAYGRDSSGLNTALHKAHRGEELTAVDRAHLAAHKHIDAALNKARISSDTHVYTGLKHSPVKMFREQKAQHKMIRAQLPAYTSTTTNLRSARTFTAHDITDSKAHPAMNADAPEHIPDRAEHVLKIHLPRGTKAGSLRSQARWKSEQEVLLHRGHHIDVYPHPTVLKDGTHVWHASVVSHKPQKIS